MLAADVPAWLVRLTSFVFASLWGSFFNVAIYRWPLGMSVVKPPSHCPNCKAPVRWYLNVPIFGYALLKGKARCCGAPLSPRYVWVELITAVLGLAALTVAAVWFGSKIPTGFVPDEDQGYFYMNVQLPDAASLQRTDEVCKRIEKQR